MKRTIGSLGSFILLSSAAFGVVSCAPKNELAVTLEIPTDNQGSGIVMAYRNVIDRYNRENPDSPLKMKLLVTPINSLKDKIASGLQLPNLYLAYPDSISNYDVLLQLRDNQRGVVNMAEVINWDEGLISQWWNHAEDLWLDAYLDNGKQINPNGLTGDKTLDQITNGHNSYRPFLNSFLHESLIPGTADDSVFMYSAPVVKSNFIGAINLRLLNDLITKVLGDQGRLIITNPDPNDPNKTLKRQIRDPYFIKSPKLQLRDVKINSPENSFGVSSRNRYKNNLDLTFGEFFEQLAGEQDQFQLQRFLGDLSNVEILLSAYWNLVGEASENRVADNWVKTLGYATDDISATTGIMQSQVSGESKQMISWDPNQPYKFFINTQNQPNLHHGLESFIDFARWGNDHKILDRDGSNTPDHGSGGLGLKANSTSKDYYSNQWIRQGMLLYYGSSSGVKYMTGTKDNQVHNEDVMLAPIPVYEDTMNKPNWSVLFRQQGAGLGMFKDQNVLKNQVAIRFLNYFLSPEVNVEFAIQAGYIPTNYRAYYNTEYQAGQLPDKDAPYYQEILKGDQSRVKGANIIQSLVDGLSIENIKLWITEPSPFGETINFQILQPWFQKYYKVFFDGGPYSQNLTWTRYEEDLYKEAKRVINSMFPTLAEVVWNGKVIN